MQAYSDPSRESDPHALPDVEVFYLTLAECQTADPDGITQPGWYWWACSPGCLPDSEPNGPFGTESAALEDARSEAYAADDSNWTPIDRT